jgi:hypothetical protein
MLLQADGCRTKPNPLRHPSRTSDECLWHHDRLKSHGMVFTDPKLGETQLLCLDDQLQVFFEALAEFLLRWVKWHDEHAKLDWRFIWHGSSRCNRGWLSGDV